MLLSFTLSMPGNNSWNGKWTDSSKNYFKVVSFVSAKNKLKAAKIAAQQYYSYNFGDGWIMGITVEIVETSEAEKLRRISDGFCGYDWAIDSIIKDGGIYGPTQPKPTSESTEITNI